MGGQCCSKVFCCIKPKPNQQVDDNFSSLSQGTSNRAFHNDTVDRHVPTPAYRPEPVRDTAAADTKSIYVALYDFEACEEGDLSLSEGERLLLLNKKFRHWWYFQSLRSGSKGYAPSNYVVQSEDDLQQQSWFVGKISRPEARRRLLQNGNEVGTFLIRDSETYPGNYSLSIVRVDDKNGKTVSHYNISRTENDHFIMKPDTRTFLDLKELVAHYSKNNEGIVIKLGKPCPVRERPLPQTLGRDAYEIVESSIKLREEIGSGHFSTVYKGFWYNTEVAIKVIDDNIMSQKDILAEVQIMKSLNHNNIVKLWGVVSEKRIMIVTEYMEQGSLFDYLGNDEGTSFSERKDMCIQIAVGMSYLESKNFIHRDLRAANVLVGNGRKYKIADFGLARFIPDDIYWASGKPIPIKWTALEALTRRKFSIKSDVWSYGVLLYEIFSGGEVPYPGIDNVQLADYLRSGYRQSSPSDCPKEVYAIMKQCWDKNPNDRPSFADLQERFEELFYDDTYVQFWHTTN